MKLYFFGKVVYFDFNVSFSKFEVVYFYYVVFVVVFFGNSCWDDNFYVGLFSNFVKIVFWFYIYIKCFILIKERIKFRWLVLIIIFRDVFSVIFFCIMFIIKLFFDDDFLIL